MHQIRLLVAVRSSVSEVESDTYLLSSVCSACGFVSVGHNNNINNNNNNKCNEWSLYSS